MGAGDAVGGFFSGFSQGLAGGVNTARERRDRLKREEQERKARLGAALLPHAIENAESEDDLREVLRMLDPEFDTPQPGTKGGKKKPSAFESIKPHLAPWLGGNAKVFGMGGAKDSVESAPAAVPTTSTAQPAAKSAPGNAPGSFTDPLTPPFVETAQPATLGQTDIAAGYGAAGRPPAQAQAPAPGPVGAAAQTATGIDTSIASPTSTYGQKPPGTPTGATVAPSGKSFYGIETGTKEERAVRQIDRARKVLVEMKKVDPNANLEDALYMLKTGTMQRDYASASGGRAQAVRGEVIDENGKRTPAYGVFDPARRQFLDADTQEPMPNFRPLTTSASNNPMGVIGNRAAIALGFNSATEAIEAGQQAQLTSKVEELLKSDSLQRGRGTGQARIETELKTPIGTTAAAAYNVPPTTTLEELRDRIALSPEQYDKLASLGQVDLLLGEIDTLIPSVFPNVQPGLWGRVQTQFSLAKQKLMADSDYAALDASINAALAQIAQLSGQPGSRLSDRDVELAKSTMANLSPQWFGGDTRQSAMARMRELRKLFDKAQGSVIRPTVSAGGSVTPAPAPGGGVGAGAPPPAVVPSRQPATGPAGVTMDAKGNILDASGKVIVPAQ